MIATIFFETPAGAPEPEVPMPKPADPGNTPSSPPSVCPAHPSAHRCAFRPHLSACTSLSSQHCISNVLLAWPDRATPRTPPSWPACQLTRSRLCPCRCRLCPCLAPPRCRSGVPPQRCLAALPRLSSARGRPPSCQAGAATRSASHHKPAALLGSAAGLAATP